MHIIQDVGTLAATPRLSIHSADSNMRTHVYQTHVHAACGKANYACMKEGSSRYVLTGLPGQIVLGIYLIE